MNRSENCCLANQLVYWIIYRVELLRVAVYSYCNAYHPLWRARRLGYLFGTRAQTLG